MFFITVKFDNEPLSEFNRIATKCIDTCECLAEASKLVTKACQHRLAKCRLTQCLGLAFVIEDVNFSFTHSNDDTEVVARIKVTCCLENKTSSACIR